MEFIVTVKTTRQTSEDSWERATKLRTADDSITLKELREWVDDIGGDWDTVELYLNDMVRRQSV